MQERRLTMLGFREEELLSYLIGLAPVGREFAFRRRHAVADLWFVFDEPMKGLIVKGFVQRVAFGNAGGAGLYRVLRRYDVKPLIRSSSYEARPVAEKRSRKPLPAPVVYEQSYAEIARLKAKGLGGTAIAALLRVPYRMVSA